jgi:hypothetical protein
MNKYHVIGFIAGVATTAISCGWYSIHLAKNNPEEFDKVVVQMKS